MLRVQPVGSRFYSFAQMPGERFIFTAFRRRRGKTAAAAALRKPRKVVVKLFRSRAQYERESGFLERAKGIENVCKIHERVCLSIRTSNNKRRRVCGFAMTYFSKGHITTFAESRNGRVPLSRWISDLTRALAAIHERGIVHGDIKSDNVLVSERGRVHLTDFGSAMLLEEIEAARESGVLSEALDYVGTLGTSSPELIARDAARFDGRANDVWCLGVLVFQLFTSELPLEAYLKRRQLSPSSSPPLPSTEEELAREFLLESAFVRGFHRLIPDPLASDFVRRACSPAPEDRPSASELARHPLCDFTRPAGPRTRSRRLG